MTDLHHLSPSVEQLLRQICTEHSQPPPNAAAIRWLVTIGEEASLQLLRKISSSKKIYSISGLIIYMATKRNGSNGDSPPDSSSPQKKTCFNSPLQKQLQFSPVSDSGNAAANHASSSPDNLMLSGGVNNDNSSPIQSPVKTVQWFKNSQGSALSSSVKSTCRALPFLDSENMNGASNLIKDTTFSAQIRIPSSAIKNPNPSRFSHSLQLGLPNTTTQDLSSQLIALAELEFRKAFLILSYSAGKRLEDIISADQIRRMTHLTMCDFELQVWKAFGHKYINQGDRRMSADWDSGKTYLYHCCVSEDGTYTFKGPFLNKERNHLQRVLGDDNVLNAKFAEELPDTSNLMVRSGDYRSRFNKIFTDGILVGTRGFRFFVFKDSGKEGKKKDPTSSRVKCFFACIESHESIDSNSSYVLSNKSVYEARCLFMHAHKMATVSKYMSRFSLVLSKTIKLNIDLASVNIEEIMDIPCRDEKGFVVFNEDGEPRIHTDGTGFISEDLAAKCPKNIYKGKENNTPTERFLYNAGSVEKVSELEQTPSQSLELPLLIQCRMFHKGSAVKGTLLVNRKLPRGTIQYRPSMLKVKSDKLLHTPTVNSLEVVGTSNQPKKTFLSRYLIALLHYGGVEEQFFMDIVNKSLEEAQNVHYNKRAAFRASLTYGDMDKLIVALMISSGIPLNEPYLQDRLSIFMREEKKSLKGGRLPIRDSFYLMGTSDPTGMLKSDEVCIILDNGQISGKVLVYKHPGLHFGDIHVLKATYVKEMEDFVGNAKYAIFFPTQGPRSLADEMAGSDFDGDMYFVSRNFQLLSSFTPSDPWIPTNYKGHVLDKRPNEPWTRTDGKERVIDKRPTDPSICSESASDRKPTDFSFEDLEHELFQLFLATRFQPSPAIGVAADSWLVFMDRLLILGSDSDKEIEIVKKKILQLIDIYYDALDAPKSGMKIEVPEILKPISYPHYMERKKSYNSSSILGKIFDRVEEYQIEDQATQEILPLPCLAIEVPESCLNIWRSHYRNYLKDMTDALNQPADIKNESADAVVEKYKWILYEAPDFEETHRNIEEVCNEAIAIYIITYENARRKKKVGPCSFAWKVAGKPL